MNFCGLILPFDCAYIPSFHCYHMHEKHIHHFFFCFRTSKFPILAKIVRRIAPNLTFHQSSGLAFPSFVHSVGKVEGWLPSVQDMGYNLQKIGRIALKKKSTTWTQRCFPCYSKFHTKERSSERVCHTGRTPLAYQGCHGSIKLFPYLRWLSPTRRYQTTIWNERTTVAGKQKLKAAPTNDWTSGIVESKHFLLLTIPPKLTLTLLLPLPKP